MNIKPLLTPLACLLLARAASARANLAVKDYVLHPF